MTYEKICWECGTRFATMSSCAKFCESCREIAYKKGRKRHSVALLNDTDAMVQACLTCSKLNCGGECERLAKVARGEA